MPTASDELREKMKGYFGDAISDYWPERFLKKMGWTETKWVWTEPAGASEISEKEWDCIKFLIDEWDHDYKPRAK